MDKPTLKDKGIFPSEEVLRQVLGSSYMALEQLFAELCASEIIPEWRYYTDGNVWLCKFPFKKKNLGWLSVYEGYFRVTCYFTEKHLEKIDALDISESVKQEFYNATPSGKLIPMTFLVRTEELPDDVLKMIMFKSSLK